MSKGSIKTGKNWLKKLIKEDVGLIYTTVGGMGSSVIAAFFWFILASLLKVDNYGLANYYIAIATIFAGVGTIGLNMTVTTYLAKGENKLLNEANSLTLIAGVASALVLSVFQWASGLLAASMIFFGMTAAEKALVARATLQLAQRHLRYGYTPTSYPISHRRFPNSNS